MTELKLHGAFSATSRRFAVGHAMSVEPSTPVRSQERHLEPISPNSSRDDYVYSQWRDYASFNLWCVFGQCKVNCVRLWFVCVDYKA